MTSSWIAQELACYGPPTSAPQPTPLATAEAYCRQLARRHYENFTVAHLLLPRRFRQHFYHLYAYCRWADDLADETTPGESVQLLAWWESELDAMYAGHAWHPVFVALRETVEKFQIPRQPLADLLVAFRQDQEITRYETVHDLEGYCRYSANPVGRLVLHLMGRAQPRQLAWSDSICTGLQWANFCQDVARDWDRGRIYLPEESRGRHNCTLESWETRTADAPFRRMLAGEVARAEDFLLAGAPLIDAVERTFRRQMSLFVNGGLAICSAIRAQHFDVWSHRPEVSRWQKLKLFLLSPTPEKVAGRNISTALADAQFAAVEPRRESA